MACYHPLKGYRSRVPGANGKRKIVFNPRDGFSDLPILLPCGQCIGCRLERSRQWAIRCMHEAQLHDENSYITLTYNDKNLPKDGSLNLRHFQLFMKRLRKKTGKKIRFYHCGEYGEKFKRPHYHACLFGYQFPDLRYFKTINGNKLYTSKYLDSVWTNKNGETMGFSTIGNVTFESAAYVARYIMKKINGEKAEAHYVNKETGEILKPEYTTMSRRPGGLGAEWLKKYKTDVYPGDFVVVRGKKMKPPKYYDRQYELTYPSDFEKIRSSRIREAKNHLDDNTPKRLRVKEIVTEAKLKRLPRNLEKE